MGEERCVLTEGFATEVSWIDALSPLIERGEMRILTIREACMWSFAIYSRLWEGLLRIAICLLSCCALCIYEHP